MKPIKYKSGKIYELSCNPGKGWWNFVRTNKKNTVNVTKIIVVPILKKVEETISNISPKKKLHTIDNDEKSVESHYKLYNEILN